MTDDISLFEVGKFRIIYMGDEARGPITGIIRSIKLHGDHIFIYIQRTFDECTKKLTNRFLWINLKYVHQVEEMDI